MSARALALALVLAGLVVMYSVDIGPRHTALADANLVPAVRLDIARPRRVDQIAVPEDAPARQALTTAQSDPFHPALPESPKPSAAPPPRASPSLPPAPQAPPLTYRYFGRIAGPDGKAEIYLTKDSLLFAIAEGVMLDERYRVDAVGPNEVRLTYLPLGILQSIPVPAE